MHKNQRSTVPAQSIKHRPLLYLESYKWMVKCLKAGATCWPILLPPVFFQPLKSFQQQNTSLKHVLSCCPLLALSRFPARSEGPTMASSSTCAPDPTQSIRDHRAQGFGEIRQNAIIAHKSIAPDLESKHVY